MSGAPHYKKAGGLSEWYTNTVPDACQRGSDAVRLCKPSRPMRWSDPKGEGLRPVDSWTGVGKNPAYYPGMPIMREDRGRGHHQEEAERDSSFNPFDLIRTDRPPPDLERQHPEDAAVEFDSGPQPPPPLRARADASKAAGHGRGARARSL